MSASAQRKRAVIAWAVSLAFHVEALVVGAVLWTDHERDTAGRQAPAPAVEIAIDVELPALTLASVGPALLIVEEVGGERQTPRPDGDRAGRGGDATVDAPAINLAPRDDEASLTRTLTSGHEAAQQVRQRNGTRRRSPEDDTIASRPMILTFIADGAGVRPSLRPEDGAPRSRLPLRPQGDPRIGEGSSPRAERAPAIAAWRNSRPGTAETSPSLPMALTGRPSTPADAVGPQEDTRDGAQEAPVREPSLLAASTAGGEEAQGRGGEEGPGRTGAGGERGPGSRSEAQGAGRGSGAGVDPGDLYLRRAHAKIHATWSPASFPREAALAGRGGTTIVAYTIVADGSVRHVQIVRPSGFPGFDAAMRAAVLRAAPFGPLPARFGRSVQRTHEFVVVNPPVR